MGTNWTCTWKFKIRESKAELISWSFYFQLMSSPLLDIKPRALRLDLPLSPSIPAQYALRGATGMHMQAEPTF